MRSPTAHELRRQCEAQRQTLGIGPKAWIEYLEEHYGHARTETMSLWQLKTLTEALRAKFDKMMKEGGEATKKADAAVSETPFIFRRG